jgi:magnesium transporter
MLINCVAYEDGHKLSDIPVSDIDQWIAKPGCFVWVALKDATPLELTQMQQEFGLHELAVEDARNGHQRPKLEEYGSTLFVVMKIPAGLCGRELRVVNPSGERARLSGRAPAL